MPIYLIRHGQSEFNAAHVNGGPDPMIFDARLTKLGVEQAKRARISAQKLNIQTVIVSPFTRALQTAQYIFGGTHWLNVMIGPHEQLSHSCDVGRSPKDLQVDFPDLSFDGIPEVWWHTGKPNELGYTVEKQDIFAPRIAEFVKTLADMSPRPVAIVAHGNVFKEMTGFEMENCEIHKYQN